MNLSLSDRYREAYRKRVELEQKLQAMQQNYRYEIAWPFITGPLNQAHIAEARAAAALLESLQ